MYSYGCTPFCFTNSDYSQLNYFDNYLKSLSNKFLTNASSPELINSMLSIKTKRRLTVKAIYFSQLFGITSIFTSNLPFSGIII